MVAIPSRRLIHNLNEIRRLESRHFMGLAQGVAKTAAVCGGELKALALHYKTYLGTRRLGLDAKACQDIEGYFRAVAQAMDQLQACLQNQPRGVRALLDTYEHGHSAWTLDGSRRTVDVNHALMQLWQDGHAAEWLLATSSTDGKPEGGDGCDGDDSGEDASGRGNRQEELRHLASLMHRLAGIYQGLQEQPQAHRDERPASFDEKDALVFNLADLIKKKARPVLHTVDIAASIHEWATGDQHPQRTRFQAAYQSWKNRPDLGRRTEP